MQVLHLKQPQGRSVSQARCESADKWQAAVQNGSHW